MKNTRCLYKMEQNSRKNERLYETRPSRGKFRRPRQNNSSVPRHRPITSYDISLQFTSTFRVASVEGESLQRDLIRKATYASRPVSLAKGQISRSEMKRSRGRSSKKVFHRDWLEIFPLFQLVSFDCTLSFLRHSIQLTTSDAD